MDDAVPMAVRRRGWQRFMKAVRIWADLGRAEWFLRRATAARSAGRIIRAVRCSERAGRILKECRREMDDE